MEVMTLKFTCFTFTDNYDLETNLNNLFATFSGINMYGTEDSIAAPPLGPELAGGKWRVRVIGL